MFLRKHMGDLRENLGRGVMTFRIDKALVAVCAISIVCALGASAKAETAASDSNGQTLSKSRDHRASAKRPHQYATVAQNGTQPQVREPARPQYYTWGAPPRQDSRDAYQGYFANPVDNPRYYGTGRATLIFRQ
jgi:hypothetical protein